MNEPTDRNSADLDRALGELQAYVDGFVKKKPGSKANRYFKELETSIDKVRTVDYINHSMRIHSTQFCNILYKTLHCKGVSPRFGTLFSIWIRHYLFPSGFSIILRLALWLG